MIGSFIGGMLISTGTLTLYLIYGKRGIELMESSGESTLFKRIIFSIFNVIWFVCLIIPTIRLIGIMNGSYKAKFDVDTVFGISFFIIYPIIITTCAVVVRKRYGKPRSVTNKKEKWLVERFATERAVIYSGIDENSRKQLRRCIEEAEKIAMSGVRERVDMSEKALQNAVASVSPICTEQISGVLPERIIVKAGTDRIVDFTPNQNQTTACDGIVISAECNVEDVEATLMLGYGIAKELSFTEYIPLPVKGGRIWLSFDLLKPAITNKECVAVSLDSKKDIEVSLVPLYYYREIKLHSRQ